MKDRAKRLLHPLTAFPRRARRPPPGTAPGLLQPREDGDVPPPRVEVIAYDSEQMVREPIDDLSLLESYRGRWPVLWVNVDGVEHVETVRRIGELFDLHRLALEDVVNVPQRSKVEDYGETLFIVARMARLTPELHTEQIGIFLGPGFVLTFQEEMGDPLDPVRERLRTQSGRIRTAGADYLAYAVLDAIVDHYFPVLEQIGDRLDAMEEEILFAPTKSTMARLYEVKRDLAALRRAVWPARDALNSLVRDETPLIDDTTRLYLRDCYDHVVQSIDLLESYRDLTSSLTDLYLSNLGHRTNETMRVLTIFAAIFIPLTFIAGIYGMNFDPSASRFNMPELHWVWGYPFALGFMALVAISMLLYFRKKGWIGHEPRS